MNCREKICKETQVENADTGGLLTGMKQLLSGVAHFIVNEVIIGEKKFLRVHTGGCLVSE